MPGKAVRFPQDILDWFEAAAASENEIRRRAGLLPIANTDLLRLVAGKFAGLPASHQVDLDAVQARMQGRTKARAGKGSSSFITTPPNPPTGKARAGKGSSSFITTPPNPPTGKARAGKGSS